ncbi:hypothetical protein DID77_03265 [Candidatus Marinamargulisbacteria bacterium SCGC AG-439-L15]|nr:hypothetical protein DID77_03265 [Candidatus Marinamargulisbacteria bacterium SCGC AG-439-L15]
MLKKVLSSTPNEQPFASPSSTTTAKGQYHQHTPKKVAAFLDAQDAIIIPVIEGAGQGLEMPVIRLIDWLQGLSSKPLWIYLPNKPIYDKFLPMIQPKLTTDQVRLYRGFDMESTDHFSRDSFNEAVEKTTKLIALSPASDSIPIAKQMADEMGISELFFFQPFKWKDEERGYLFKKESVWYYHLPSGHLYHKNSGAPLSPTNTTASLEHSFSELTVPSQSILKGLLTAMKSQSIEVITLYIHYLPKPFDTIFIHALQQAYQTTNKPCIFLIKSALSATSLSPFTTLDNNAEFPQDLSPGVYIVKPGRLSEAHLYYIMKNSVAVVGEGSNTHNECLKLGVPMICMGSQEELTPRFSLSPKTKKELSLIEHDAKTLSFKVRNTLVPASLIENLAWYYEKPSVSFGVSSTENLSLSQLFANLLKKVSFQKYKNILNDPNDTLPQTLYDEMMLWIWLQCHNYQIKKDLSPKDAFAQLLDDSKKSAPSLKLAWQTASIFEGEELVQSLSSLFNEDNGPSLTTFLSRPFIRELCTFTSDDTIVAKCFTDKAMTKHAQEMKDQQAKATRDSFLMALNTLRVLHERQAPIDTAFSYCKTLQPNIPSLTIPTYPDNKEAALALMTTQQLAMNSFATTYAVPFYTALDNTCFPTKLSRLSIYKFIYLDTQKFSRARIDSSLQKHWNSFWDRVQTHYNRAKGATQAFLKWHQETFVKYLD